MPRVYASIHGCEGCYPSRFDTRFDVEGRVNADGVTIEDVTLYDGGSPIMETCQHEDDRACEALEEARDEYMGGL